MNWRTFVPYNKNYPKIFELEKQRLKVKVGDVVIEHFGSTAVPGLGGKGYIDVYMAVPKKEMKKYLIKVQKHGYEHRPGGDVVGERFFLKRKLINKHNDDVTFNLHITYLKSENFKSCLAFRDYLKLHPKDAKKYTEAKKVAVEVANKEKDRKKAVEAYMKSKSEIIKDISQKILSKKV
ncbi:GrpB family protein [Patescibacteria group bacterium]